MASKYERITDLYLQTVGEVAKPEVWPQFLTTACHNFRLSFDKQILLYAQRPDATAVLPIEGRQGWNQRFGRWVNRGSKGIAMLDSDSNGQGRIKYYFDIADTHEGRHPRPVPIWTVRPEQEQAIMETLENSFGALGNKENLGDALLSAASNVMEDNFQDYLAQLDEALCIGFNDRNSRLIICAYFMKDKPLEDNAAFLQKHYGTNGAGLFIQDREYAIWYDVDSFALLWQKRQ